MKSPNAVKCRDAAYYEGCLYAYAENEAPPEIRAEVEAHVKECAYCRSQLDDILFMIHALREDAPAVPDQLHAHIMHGIHAEISDRQTKTAAPTNGEKPFAFMAKKQKQSEQRQARIRLIGGLAAACVIALGLWQILPFLAAGSGAASGDAAKVLSDMQSHETGEGDFVGGVFVGGDPADNGTGASPTQSNPPDTAAVEAEATVLDAIWSIFSGGSDRHEIETETKEVQQAPGMTLTVAKSAESRLFEVLDTMAGEGALSFYTAGNCYHITMKDTEAAALLAALSEKQIAVTVHEQSGDPAVIEITVH